MDLAKYENLNNKSVKYIDIEPCKNSNNFFAKENTSLYDKKQVLLDTNHELIATIVSGFNSDGIAVVENQDGLGLIDNEGNIVLECKYKFESRMYPKYDRGLLKVSKNDCFGLVDKLGVFVVPCKYPDFVHFSDGVQYDFIGEGYIMVYHEDKYGLIYLANSEEYFLDCIYDSIHLHSNRKYIFIEDDLTNDFKCIVALSQSECLIVELNTREILFSSKNFEYGIEIITDRYIVFSSVIGDGIEKYYLYSIQEETILSKFAYDGIGRLSERFLQVKKDECWGLFDLHLGEEAIPCEHFKGLKFNGDISPDFMINQGENLVLVCKNELWGYINLENQLIIEYKYEFARSFSEGLAAVKKGGKWGYINKLGKLVIPCRFAKADSFSEGLAAVAFKVQWGYIDKHNNTVIPFSFKEAFPFIEGIASVWYDDGKGQINMKGELLDYQENRICDIEEIDYAADTWDALTDGMYGDYPGYDSDYEMIGF